MAEKSVFKLEDLPSVWDLTCNLDWVVSNLIPDSSVILLSGESGCGKSTLTLALVDAVTSGSKFLNHDCKQREVLIVDRENGASIYHERLDRLKISKTDNLHIWGIWNDKEPEGPDSLSVLEFARKFKPLIIYDSLIAFHTGDESNSFETRLYMQKFRRLASVGATVLVIHHTGKGESTKLYRGSSDIMASIDVGLLLTSKPGLTSLYLKPFKVREGIIEPTKIDFDGERFIAVADDIETLLRDLIKNKPGLNELQILGELDGVSIPQKRIRDTLHRGVLNGWLVAPKGPKNANCYHLAS